MTSMNGFFLTCWRVRAEVREAGLYAQRGAFPLLRKCWEAGQYFSHRNRQGVHTLQEREVEASEGFARLFEQALQTRYLLP